MIKSCYIVYLIIHLAGLPKYNDFMYGESAQPCLQLITFTLQYMLSLVIFTWFYFRYQFYKTNGALKSAKTFINLRIIDSYPYTAENAWRL